VTLLADIIVVVHALIAAFITLGFVAVPVGAWLNWRLVRCRWLRLVHLVSILFVAGETVLGFVCPLTAWEDWLRGGNANGAGFIARWVRWGLYYDAPLWMFARSRRCCFGGGFRPKHPGTHMLHRSREHLVTSRGAQVARQVAEFRLRQLVDLVDVIGRDGRSAENRQPKKEQRVT
jgi:hypothetical protein